MAIIKQVWNARLVNHGAPHAEAAAELAVVKQDRDDEVLFSIVEAQGAVKHRVTFSLSSSQAVGLARFLGGIALAPRARREADPSEIDGEIDDERTPTLPGRPISLPSPDDDGEDGDEK